MSRRHFVSNYTFRLVLILTGACLPALGAETPPLLAKAIAQWASGQEDLAFTQQTRFFFDDGKVKEERIERYDPSLPDSSRWRLVQVDGHPPTNEQREKWETKKNGKPRLKVVKSPAEYLDLPHAKLTNDTPESARFEIDVRPQAARLLAVEKIAVVVTIDKKSGGIAGLTATLRQPIRVLLGLARITDLEIDVLFESSEGDSVRKAGEVKAGGTAHVAMSKWGNQMEYNWSDFRRVAPYRTP